MSACEHCEHEALVLAGVYRAVVRRTNDPEGKNRIVVVCPAVAGAHAELGWAMPVLPVGTAVVSLPQPGDPVWIMFEHGSVDSPVWLGTWLTTGTV